MRTIVYEQYGGPEVVTVAEVDRPTADGDRVLIKVHAASLNRSDWEALTARPFYVRLGGTGFWRPKHGRLGTDIAGVIEAVGEAVDAFEVGDEVLADMLWHGSGGLSEYAHLTQRAPMVVKPAGVSFEQAAALPQAGGLAWQALTERGGIGEGDQVAILGGGGGGGSFAIQIAKHFGAEVTAVDRPEKLDFMRSLGADHVVDFTRENFVKGGRRFDLIVDFVGKRSPFAIRRALTSGGRHSMIGGSMPRLIQLATIGWLLSKLSGVSMRVMMAKPTKEDLATLADLVATQTIQPAIGGRYALSEAAAALEMLGSERGLGKLVIAP